MGIINVYNTLSNEKKVYKANGKLRNIFPKMDFSKSIVSKAGERVNGEYEVTPEDILYCRVVPGSTSVMAVIAIVSAVVAAGVGVGSAIYAKKKSDEAKEQMEKAQRDADNLASAVNQLPFCRGSKNVSALGRSVQFVMGDVYNTPYKLSDGFYSIDGQYGENSYYNVALSLGNAQQIVKDVLIGEEVVCSTASTSGLSGENDFDSDSLYYDANLTNKVDVRCGAGNFTNQYLNYKVSSTFALAELKHEFEEEAVPVIVQASDNAWKIQVCIQFDSLRQYNPESESWVSRQATVRPYWSNDSGNTWHEFYFQGMNNNTINLNVNHTVRFVAEKTFSKSESFNKNIVIKVVKDSPKAQSNSQETCALLWYQTFCYDPQGTHRLGYDECPAIRQQNKTARIGFKIQASDNTNDILDEIHAHCVGKAHIYDSDNDNWETFAPTRNPAAWIKELLTTDFHSPSMVQDSELDLNSFVDLYEYCEENNFYCDGIITNEEKKIDIIQKILSSVNADLIINNDGKYSIVIDKEETNPVALLNDENIVSFTYSKDLNRRVDGEKVTFVNRENWMPDTFYAMLDGGAFDSENDIVEPISFDYVTTYEHAYKMAQRKMRQRQLMPFELKAEVGSEGYSYPLYSLIKAQITMLQQGIRSSLISGLVTENGNITKIKIADLVTFEQNKRYGVTIQATTNYRRQIYNVEVTGTGATRELTLVTPIEITNTSPIVSNHLSFGLLDDEQGFTKVTNLFKIYGIEPKDNGYTLTLRTYNPEVYSYGGTIPEYTSNLTKRQAPSRTVTVEQLNDVRRDMGQMQQDLINAYQSITMPIVVDADNKQFMFEVNTLGETIKQYTFETQIFCRQGSEEREFTIGSMNLPEGWSFTVANGKITFTIGAGVKIINGNIVVPVIYRPAVNTKAYVNQDGISYANEESKAYIQEVMSTSTVTNYIYINYFGMSGGSYIGLLDDISDIPLYTTLVINDYFVWGGTDNTNYDLVINGKLKKGEVYKYIGDSYAWKFDVDTSNSHLTYVLGDVLGIANADLEHNNSFAYEYLDHLTANSIYVNKLVANQEFVDLLTARVINVGELITVGGVDTKIAESELEALSKFDAIGSAATAQTTAISTAAADATQKANAAESNAITTASNDATTKANGAIDNVLTQLVGSGNVRNHTIISGGKIITGLIDVDAIKAHEGFFDNINVSGKITALEGLYQTNSAGVYNYSDFINNLIYLIQELGYLGSATISGVLNIKYNETQRFEIILSSILFWYTQGRYPVFKGYDLINHKIISICFIENEGELQLWYTNHPAFFENPWDPLLITSDGIEVTDFRDLTYYLSCTL